ncbi:hypothetical protein Vafri_5574, partial [Volvox africanus]
MIMLSRMAPHWRTALLISFLSVSAGPLGAFATHFRSGIISYAPNRQDPTLLDVTVTSSWATNDNLDIYVRTPQAGNQDAFDTNRNDFVGDGYDPAGNYYLTLRTTRSIPVPTDLPALINTWGCCRIEGLVGYGDYDGYNEYKDFAFATMYVAGAPSSIIVDALPFMIAGQAASGGLAYFFVPAISPRGGAINCSINRDIAFTDPYELTVTPITGGCSIGWNNSEYSIGATAPVGLRVTDTATGQYNDITFLVTMVDPKLAPVVTSVTSTGKTLPQASGNITILIQTQVQVVITATDPFNGTLTAASSSLPLGATLTTTPRGGASSVTVTFTWTPTIANNGSGIVLIVIRSSSYLYTTVSFSYKVIRPTPPFPPPPPSPYPPSPPPRRPPPPSPSPPRPPPPSPPPPRPPPPLRLPPAPLPPLR